MSFDAKPFLANVSQRPGVYRMLGATGVARDGRLVFVNGELWQAVAEDGQPLEPGERVAVDDVQGLRLVVHRV